MSNNFMDFTITVPEHADPSMQLALAMMELIRNSRGIPAEYPIKACNKDIWDAIRFVWARQNTSEQPPL